MSLLLEDCCSLLEVDVDSYTVAADKPGSSQPRNSPGHSVTMKLLDDPDDWKQLCIYLILLKF